MQGVGLHRPLGLRDHGLVEGGGCGIHFRLGGGGVHIHPASGQDCGLHGLPAFGGVVGAVEAVGLGEGSGQGGEVGQLGLVTAEGEEVDDDVVAVVGVLVVGSGVGDGQAVLVVGLTGPGKQLLLVQLVGVVAVHGLGVHHLVVAEAGDGEGHDGHAHRLAAVDLDLVAEEVHGHGLIGAGALERLAAVQGGVGQVHPVAVFHHHAVLGVDTGEGEAVLGGGEQGNHLVHLGLGGALVLQQGLGLGQRLLEHVLSSLLVHGQVQALAGGNEPGEGTGVHGGDVHLGLLALGDGDGDGVGDGHLVVGGLGGDGVGAGGGEGDGAALHGGPVVSGVGHSGLGLLGLAGAEVHMGGQVHRHGGLAVGDDLGHGLLQNHTGDGVVVAAGLGGLGDVGGEGDEVGSLAVLGVVEADGVGLVGLRQLGKVVHGDGVGGGVVGVHGDGLHFLAVLVGGQLHVAGAAAPLEGEDAAGAHHVKLQIVALFLGVDDGLGVKGGVDPLGVGLRGGLIDDLGLLGAVGEVLGDLVGGVGLGGDGGLVACPGDGAQVQGIQTAAQDVLAAVIRHRHASAHIGGVGGEGGIHQSLVPGQAKEVGPAHKLGIIGVLVGVSGGHTADVHVVVKGGVGAGVEAVLAIGHGGVGEVPDVVGVVHLIPLVHGVAVLIGDKGVVVHLGALQLGGRGLAHRHDLGVVGGKHPAVIHRQVEADGVVAVVGVLADVEHVAAAVVVVGVVVLDDAVPGHVVQVEGHAVVAVDAVAHLVVLEHHAVGPVTPDAAAVALIGALEAVHLVVLHQHPIGVDGDDAGAGDIVDVVAPDDHVGVAEGHIVQGALDVGGGDAVGLAVLHGVVLNENVVEGGDLLGLVQLLHGDVERIFALRQPGGVGDEVDAAGAVGGASPPEGVGGVGVGLVLVGKAVGGAAVGVGGHHGVDVVLAVVAPHVVDVAVADVDVVDDAVVIALHPDAAAVPVHVVPLVFHFQVVDLDVLLVVQVHRSADLVPGLPGEWALPVLDLGHEVGAAPVNEGLVPLTVHIDDNGVALAAGALGPQGAGVLGAGLDEDLVSRLEGLGVDILQAVKGVVRGQAVPVGLANGGVQIVGGAVGGVRLGLLGGPGHSGDCQR